MNKITFVVVDAENTTDCGTNEEQALALLTRIKTEGRKPHLVVSNGGDCE